MRLRNVAAVALMAALSSSTLLAQQPQSTQSPEPATDDGFVDKAKRWSKDHQMTERLDGDVDGWYPRIGRMTRGAGFALGPGYRTHVFGDRVLLDVSAGLSIRTYKAVDVNARWFQSADERFELWTDYRFEDFPQEDFFGTGPDSLLDNRTSYAFRSNDIRVRGVVKPMPWLRFGADLGYMSVNTRRGRDDRFPSIEERFTDVEAPGLASQPDYVHSTLFAQVDYRDFPGNPGNGGLYRVAFGIWDDTDRGEFDFRRLDINLAQFVPLEPGRRHVVSGRVGLSYVNNDLSARVPFYVLPYIGGVDTVRSFREFRFQDENALWLGAEYVFRPIKYVGLAAFVDAGKIAHDWQDINLADMKKGYGFGVRVGTQKYQFGLIDVGFGGGEGTRVFFKVGPRL
jgi:outer membrane protein assembly factor BamA